MSSPEREEVAKQLIEEYELGLCNFSGPWTKRLWDALISREMRLREKDAKLKSAVAVIQRMRKYLINSPQQGFDRWRDAEDDVNTWLNSKGEKPT